MSIEGEYATSVACLIGVNIRDHALVRDIGSGDIDFGIRESIILRVGQMFGIGDYVNDMVVRRVIDKKWQSIYADWKCDLYVVNLMIEYVVNLLRFTATSVIVLSVNCCILGLVSSIENEEDATLVREQDDEEGEQDDEEGEQDNGADF